MKVNLMHGAGGEVMGELLQTLTKFSHNNAVVVSVLSPWMTVP